MSGARVNGKALDKLVEVLIAEYHARKTREALVGKPAPASTNWRKTQERAPETLKMDFGDDETPA